MIDGDGAVRELQRIKVWIAIGAIGFVLIAAAALVVAVAFAWSVSYMEEAMALSEAEDPPAFRDLAQQRFEQGQIDDLAALIAERAKTHPNDAIVSWYRAQLHVLRGEWDEALSDLRQAALLAPSWRRDYLLPFEQLIQERRRAAPSPEPRAAVE